MSEGMTYRGAGALAKAIAAARPGCRWSENLDGVWESGCGYVWEFFSDGPAENGVRFCPFCGHPLVAVPAVGPGDDQGDELSAVSGFDFPPEVS